jgi:hypothetical protein
MFTQDDYVKFLKETVELLKTKEDFSWTERANELSKLAGVEIGAASLNGRVFAYQNFGSVSDFQESVKAKKKAAKKSELPKEAEKDEEFSKDFDTGIITAKKVMSLPSSVRTNEVKLLEHLGYSPDSWEFIKFGFKAWQQSSKHGGDKDLYSVNFQIRPKHSINRRDVVDSVKAMLKTNIFEIPVIEERYKTTQLKKNRLMEIPPIELHLGKLSHREETGEDYNLPIARNVFYDVIGETIERQKIEKCSKCLLVIGSDFFNSESDGMTTGKTPQQNDTRFKKLFKEGLVMYRDAILNLKSVFDSIDVILCAGNHARAMEYFLYESLLNYFENDEKVSFSDNTKDTQAYIFGNCGIFFNHGDEDLKKTQKSIAAEFPVQWGETKFRELHMGHLHKEVVVDDESGIITRRIGSPCATDAWHYSKRFIGAVKQHQLFIWDNVEGLQTVHYIHASLRE